MNHCSICGVSVWWHDCFLRGHPFTPFLDNTPLAFTVAFWACAVAWNLNHWMEHHEQ